MKNKNRTGILTALLAVLSIRGVEFKKRIGIIAVLGVLLLATMPAQATRDPADCTASTLKIQSIFKQPTLTVNGQTIVHYAMLVGTGGSIGGCNVGNTDPGETGHGITIYFNKPAMDGKQPGDPTMASGEQLILATDKTFLADGTNDICYFSSPIGKAFCDGQFVAEEDVSLRGIDMTWLTNVNPGVTDAIARGRAVCPSNLCLHDADNNHALFNSKDVGVDVTEIPKNKSEEYWTVEWFNTKPRQYTEFLLPKDQLYLITSGFRANESTTHIWDNSPTPIAVNKKDRLKYWHNATVKEDLYVNNLRVNNQTYTTLRLYGTFGEGPGDLNAIDPDTGKKQENPGYTDPISPFFPQADQSPIKDFVTFDPAVMDHNQGWPELLLKVNGNTDQEGKEKVFKRMWYEKEWFKDDNKNGTWDVVVETSTGLFVAVIDINTFDAYFHANLPTSRNQGWRLREWNNPLKLDPSDPASRADTYGPAIKQEFSYMTLDYSWMPVLVENGSRIMIPMASYGPCDAVNGIGCGLNSFVSVEGTGRDYVTVESEDTLGMDIDNDGVMKKMDTDNVEVNGNESVVLVLTKHLTVGQSLQFFDNNVTLTDATFGGGIRYNVCDNEGEPLPLRTCTNNENIASPGGVLKYQRGASDIRGPFYIKLKSLDMNGGGATIEVGRLFGKTLANIGANDRWNQKAFIVRGVFYNVVAIKTRDNTFKYITFREKLPKFPIKLYQRELHVWPPRTLLPEMPPFNMPHEILPDVQTDHNWPIVKVPPKMETQSLKIVWVKESDETRFRGELKEIYAESLNPLKEFWEVEWFHTMPEQYTEFVLLNNDQKYLVTTGFYAPEATTHIWDGDVTNEKLIAVKHGDRLKFWFDPLDNRSLFVNNTNGAVRIYGTFGEGPGDFTAVDPDTGKKQENPGYTNWISPFYPQAEQSPRKDFVTFNPAVMDHNQGYPELLFYIDGNTDQDAKEKVFKRMWYEKEWFKDDNKNGTWDVVVETSTGTFVAIIDFNTFDAYFHANLPTSRNQGWTLREHNNPLELPANDPASQADTYGPAIKQEFSYMTLDHIWNPVLVEHGSRLLIPIANDGKGFGLNSFESIIGSGVKDAVTIESENTLGMDIDNDNVQKNMEPDNAENGNESVVLVLTKHLTVGQSLQFFDNNVTLVSASFGGGINFNVCDNEGGSPTCTNDQNIASPNGVLKYQRGASDIRGPFYVKLKALDFNGGGATIEVGRLFGKTLANIGANTRWNQKAFIVQGVFYNVVAIKAKDNTFKYITFREKLPKEEIKLYQRKLQVWGPNTPLPEMPPFNMPHEILPDVQSDWTWPIVKVPSKVPADALVVKYTIEAKEPRFKGELKEIYAENLTQTTPGPQPGGACILPNGKDLDLNSDNTIGIGDVVVLTNHWGAKDTDADWNNHKFADLNNDGAVGIGDVVVLTNNWGQSCQ